MNRRGAANYWYFIGIVIMSVVVITSLQVMRKQVVLPEAMDLRVHKSGRYLERADGRPFFWNGVFFDLKEESLQRGDLQRAKDEGVTVLLGPVLSGGSQGKATLVFLEKDSSRPNEEGFKFLDQLAAKSEELGLYLAPVILNPETAAELNAENAKKLGLWLGERYRNRSNIIWILAEGYDLSPQSGYKIYQELAEGIKEGSLGRHLMTLWPRQAGSSGMLWQGVDLIAFNLAAPNSFKGPGWILTEMDYLRQPLKPTLLFDLGDNAPLWRGNSLRSLLAGGIGVNAREAGRGKFIRQLMESRPLMQLVPDPRLLEEEQSYSPDDRCQAAADITGSYALIYVPPGAKKVVVRLDRIFAQKINAWWFNPETGKVVEAGNYETKQPTAFIKPEGTDWVLVLDDALKNYPPPGQVKKDPAKVAGER